MPRSIPSRLTAIVLVAAVSACSRTPDAPPAPPPVPVSVIVVTAGPVPYVGEYVGETESSREVEIRARVEGFLESIE